MSAASLTDIQSFGRRGACPALSAPMQTGDGLLSRVAFTSDLSPQDLERLSALAALHGNGLVDITARGGLQFRGLTVESAALLERDVLALDLPLRQGLAVETSPLAGVDETAIADTRLIVSRISETAAALGLDDRLAAKMSVVVDGGGHVPMGRLLADIRLKAVRLDDGVFWLLTLGGAEDKALTAGLLRAEDAGDGVVELLSCLAEQGPDARGRDLGIETVRGICGERLIDVTVDLPRVMVSHHYGLMCLVEDVGCGLPPSVLPDISPSRGEISRRRALGNLERCDKGDGVSSFQSPPLRGRCPAGQRGVNPTHHPLISPMTGNLFAAALAPAFGQISAEALAALCRQASGIGIKFVRPGPAHGLFFIGTDDACQALLDYAQDAGFVTGADDPRSSIAVCAGKPACASAFIPTWELADHAAVECAALLDGSFTLHLSGCGKGCAHPTSALVALSGNEEGLAFTYSGRVSNIPDVVLPLAEQKAALSRLARLYEKEHKPGENARTLLARLGRHRIVAALRQDDR